LNLEELDGRVMPAKLPWLVPELPAAVVSHRGHSLHGSALATYVRSEELELDVGVHNILRGTATLGRESFELSGWMRGVGMLIEGRASGGLVLTNARGTIMLALEGPLQPGFSPIPTKFHYTLSGTGAYEHINGSGRLTLKEIAIPSGSEPNVLGAYKMRIS